MTYAFRLRGCAAHAVRRLLHTACLPSYFEDIAYTTLPAHGLCLRTTFISHAFTHTLHALWYRTHAHADTARALPPHLRYTLYAGPTHAARLVDPLYGYAELLRLPRTHAFCRTPTPFPVRLLHAPTFAPRTVTLQHCPHFGYFTPRPRSVHTTHTHHTARPRCYPTHYTRLPHFRTQRHAT